MAKERKFVLEVDVYASEEDGLILRSGLLVKKVGEVCGEHGDVMPGIDEIASERIVAHAHATVVISRAGRDEGNFHGPVLAKPCSMGSGSSANLLMAAKRLEKSLSSTLPTRQSVRSDLMSSPFMTKSLKLKSSS